MSKNLVRAFIFRDNGKTILYRIMPDGSIHEVQMADAEGIYTDIPFNMADVVEADFNDATSLISYKLVCSIGFRDRGKDVGVRKSWRPQKEKTF